MTSDELCSGEDCEAKSELRTGAEGSLAELDTQVIIARELAYCDEQAVLEANDLIHQLRKMLNALRRRLVGVSDKGRGTSCAEQ